MLLVLIPALDLLFRYVSPSGSGIIILSALVAHTGWHWMIERGEQLAKFPFPKIDAAFLASAMRGLMAVLILALAVLLANSWLRRWIRGRQVRAPPRTPLPRRRPQRASGVCLMPSGACSCSSLIPKLAETNTLHDECELFRNRRTL